MPALDVERLSAPISEDAPCGPDLDLEGDLAFTQAVARIEGVLPTSYFTRDDEGRQQVFDRATINFGAEETTLTGLLERSRDLRPLTLYARLAALNRDLPALASAIATVAALLDTRWAEVHPQGEGGDFGLRSAVLQALDDMPTVILPLQHVALAESRRFGTISFRSVMIADGEVAAPAGGEPVDRASIARTLAEADLEALRAKQISLATIVTAAGAIYARTVAESSFEQAVNLERLTALAKRMLVLIEPVLATRDPTAGAAGAPPEAAGFPAAPGAASASGGAEPAALPVGSAVLTMARASAALAAIASYLKTFEPSSPAELLVRQARALVGKSFLDALRILVPNHAEEAKLAIAADRAVELSFGQLAALQDTNDADAGDADPESASGGDQDAQAGPDAGYDATSRRGAVDLMQRVAAFYRGVEPSSPIPLLLDRAVATMERDFLTLLKEVLPELGRREPE